MNKIMELVNISTSVSKLGVAIPTVNLPAGVTCRSNAPCAHDCYACKGNFRFANVQKSHINNLNTYLSNPDVYFGIIDLRLQAIPYKFFRYHSSGDIVDMNYLEHMVILAEKHMQTRFLCFTKKYELVNKYLEGHKEFPENLIIVLSNWGEFHCENPYDLPTAWVRLRKIETEIPENANKCSGFCGSCVNTEASCWNLKKNESVVFKQH